MSNFFQIMCSLVASLKTQPNQRNNQQPTVKKSAAELMWSLRWGLCSRGSWDHGAWNNLNTVSSEEQ